MFNNLCFADKNIYNITKISRDKMSKAAEILNQYSFNLSKPKQKISSVEVYDATHKETSLPFTIKILKNPDFKLEQYLQKMK